MKIIFISVLILQFASLFGQISIPRTVDFDSTKKVEFNTNIFHDIQSSAIPLKLSSALIQGGEIKNDLIESVLNKHAAINRIGREFVGEMQLANYQISFFKKKKYALFSELAYQSLSSGIYSKDLFELAFQGNSGFIGDTAKFAGTGFKHYTFQNFGFGLIDKKTKSYLSLNIVNVQNFAAGIISKGSYFMSADSTDVNLTMKAQSLNTYGSNFNQGLGFSLNMLLNFEVPWRNERTAIFQFRIKNFGVAKIKNLSSLSVDTTLSYSGFKFEDFITNNSSTYSNISWLDTLNVTRDTINQMIILPAMIQFGKVLDKKFTGKYQSFFGIKLYPSLYFVPKLYAGVDVKSTEELHFGATVAYGGFGIFRAGIYANYQLKNGQIGIGTEDIIGLISKNGYGQMLHLNFSLNL